MTRRVRTLGMNYKLLPYRPVLGQAPTQPIVPPSAPPAVVAETARADRNKTAALVTSGIGAAGGAVAAYSHYLRAGNKMNNWALAATVFGALNLAFFAYVLSEG